MVDIHCHADGWPVEVEISTRNEAIDPAYVSRRNITGAHVSLLTFAMSHQTVLLRQTSRGKSSR